jgi:hypothetical protein
MNLSTYQLNAVTRTSLNKTSSELINEHIILEAKRGLLATSSRLIKLQMSWGTKMFPILSGFLKNMQGIRLKLLEITLDKSHSTLFMSYSSACCCNYFCITQNVFQKSN